MKRLWAWLAGGAGGVAAYRALKHRSQPAVIETPAASDERAEELRAKLAETREHTEEPTDPDARRRAVHDTARAALEEMQGE